MNKIITTALMLSGMIAYAQPSGSCTTGITKLGSDNRLYGCVEGTWRPFSEGLQWDVVQDNQGAIGTTYFYSDSQENVDAQLVVKERDIYDFTLNTGFTPISISGQSHAIGKVIYTNKHFYMGVANGKWHQIDNEYTATKSASLSKSFTRNNCASGTGSQVTYTTPTYTETRTSYKSQTDADNLAQNAANAKAQADLNANGQTYANNNGSCFTPSAKCLERIKDRNYGDGDHNFIYCAVQGPNGKKWLNLNLGAEYARESSPDFNPEKMPDNSFDWKFFGSLFQVGRKADGHELVENYYEKNNWWYLTLKNPPVQASQSLYNSSKNMSANNNLWSSDINLEIQQGLWSPSGPNNPCPNGYHVMNSKDFFGFMPHADVNSGWSGMGESNSPTIEYNKFYPNLALVLSPLLFHYQVGQQIQRASTNVQDFLLNPAGDVQGAGFASFWIYNENPQGTAIQMNKMLGDGIWFSQKTKYSAIYQIVNNLWDVDYQRENAFTILPTADNPNVLIKGATTVRCVEN